MDRSNWKEDFTPGWLFPGLMILSSYMIPFLLFPAQGFWINDNGCKYIQTVSLIRNQFRSASIDWPGADMDPEYLFQPIAFPFGQMIRGKLHGYYSTSFSFLSSWPYRLFGFRGLYLLPLASGLLLLPAVWRMAGQLPCSGLGKPLSLLLVALGTPLWFYSVSFWEHVPAVCLTTWAVFWAQRHMARGGGLSLSVSSALCAASIALRDDFYVFAVALMVYTIAQRREISAALIAGLVGLGCLSPMWISHWISTGNPLGHHVSSVTPFQNGIGPFLEERWIAFKVLLLDAHPDTRISLFLTLPCLFLLCTIPRSGKGWKRLLPGMVLMWACFMAASAAWGHYRSDVPMDWMMRTNGLFVSAPFLTLGFLRGDSASDSRDSSLALLRISLLFCLLYASLSPAVSLIGLHWGARHLLPVFPLLGIPAASFLACLWAGTAKRALCRSGILLLLGLSLLLQLHSLRLLHQRKSFCAELNRIVREREEEIVVAVEWYLPQELAPVFFDKRIFLADTWEKERDLMGLLKRSGVKRILRVAPSSRRRDEALTVGWIKDELDFLSLEIQSLEPCP